MEIKARMPGQVIAVHVSPGDRVKTKDVLSTIEAMKMEQAVLCPQDGVVKETRIQVGDKVKTGQIIMVIE
jgi:biotin carboxyl carrier protein